MGRSGRRRGCAVLNGMFLTFSSRRQRFHASFSLTHCRLPLFPPISSAAPFSPLPLHLLRTSPSPPPSISTNHRPSPLHPRRKPNFVAQHHGLEQDSSRLIDTEKAGFRRIRRRQACPVVFEDLPEQRDSRKSQSRQRRKTSEADVTKRSLGCRQRRRGPAEDGKEEAARYEFLDENRRENTVSALFAKLNSLPLQPPHRPLITDLPQSGQQAVFDRLVVLLEPGRLGGGEEVMSDEGGLDGNLRCERRRRR